VQGGTPFSVAGALLLLSLAVLTMFWPLRSVTLFTLLAPFGNLPDLLGWDPRMYWGLMLGVRSFWEWLSRPKRTLLSRNAVLAWFLFCGVATLVLYGDMSALSYDDVAAAVSRLLYFIAASMYLFAVFQFADSEHKVIRVVRCFAVAAASVSSYAVWQACTTYGEGAAGRIVATLGNANHLATNLALASTSLLLMGRRERGWFRAFLLVSAAAALLGTVLTLSRTGTVSVLVGWALVYVTRSGRIEYRKAVPIFAVVALVAGLGVGIYLANYRQQVTFSDDPNAIDMASAQQAAEDLSRLEAALYAIQVIGEHPVLGAGFGTFAARNYNANGFYVETHDTLLQVLTGSGVVGAVLLGILVWTLARSLGKPGRILYLPVAGCFALSALFGDYLQSIDVMVILALMYLYSWYAIYHVTAAVKVVRA
jgi:hypothetical protein